MIEILLPNETNSGNEKIIYLNSEQATLVEDSLSPLSEFFHANGEGLPTKYLEEGQTSFIRSIIALFDVESQNLIDLYNSYSQTSTDTQNSIQANVVTKIHILHLIERNAKRMGDKVAINFLKKFWEKEAKKS